MSPTTYRASEVKRRKPIKLYRIEAILLSPLGVLAFVAIIVGGVASAIAWSWIPVTVGTGVFLLLAVLEAARKGGPVRKGGDDGPPSTG